MNYVLLLYNSGLKEKKITVIMSWITSYDKSLDVFKKNYVSYNTYFFVVDFSSNVEFEELALSIPC